MKNVFLIIGLVLTIKCYSLDIHPIKSSKNLAMNQVIEFSTSAYKFSDGPKLDCSKMLELVLNQDTPLNDGDLNLNIRMVSKIIIMKDYLDLFFVSRLNLKTNIGFKMMMYCDFQRQEIAFLKGEF